MFVPKATNCNIKMSFLYFLVHFHLIRIRSTLGSIQAPGVPHITSWPHPLLQFWQTHTLVRALPNSASNSVAHRIWHCVYRLLLYRLSFAWWFFLALLSSLRPPVCYCSLSLLFYFLWAMLREVCSVQDSVVLSQSVT